MAWIQKTSPPRDNTHDLVVKDFSGGLNNRSNTIEANEARDMLNLAFTDHVTLEKRHGSKPFDDLTLSEGISHVGLYQPYDDEDQLIRASESEVYAGQDKIADVQGKVDGVNFQGNYFFADGQSLQVYGNFTTTTGTHVDIIGTHPETHTTLTVSNPPDGFEPLSEEFPVGKVVYDYDNATVHYEPCMNELEDVHKGSNVLPEFPRFIELHKERLYVSGNKKDDDNVFITDIASPFYFAVSLPMQLPPNSDAVRGMAVYDDSVIVGRRFDIYRINGETNNPELGFELFTLKKINTHTGFANNQAISLANNYLFFLGSDGVFYGLGNVHVEQRVVTTQIISKQIDLEKPPINATPDDIRDASSIYEKDMWYVTVGDKTLVYSYRHKAWTVYDQIDIHAPLHYYDKIIWGRKDGKTMEFSEGHMDDGLPIYAYWESKTFDMNAPSHYKQFREFFLVAHAYDDTDSTIRINFRIDYAMSRNTAHVENMLAIWGQSKFGDRFIDRNINASIPFMIGRRARTMNIRYENGYYYEGVIPTVIDLNDVPAKTEYMCFFVEETQSYHYYTIGKWTELTEEEIDQPMRVYEFNGEYKMKGKR